jgi:hypothetical protein
MRAPLAHASGDSLELVQQQHFVGGWCSCATFRYSWTTSVQSTCCFFRTCALATGAVRLYSAVSGKCSVTKSLQPLPCVRSILDSIISSTLLPHSFHIC